MPLLTLLTTRTFYHLSLLACLLGAQIYQSFFANITASRALSSPQFRVLQASIWPMYFKLQMITSMLLLLTYTGDCTTYTNKGMMAITFAGLFERIDLWPALIPLTLMIILAATNMLVLLPKTHKVIGKKQLAIRREQKAANADGFESRELKTLQSQFLVYHGASYACNIAVLAITVWYALNIADRWL